LDLAYHRFLPTTFTKLSTMFTMAVLDDFRLANLECKILATTQEDDKAIGTGSSSRPVQRVT